MKKKAQWRQFSCAYHEARHISDVLALVKSMSPAAWRHIHLNGHYTFQGNGESTDLNAVVQVLNLE